MLKKYSVLFTVLNLLCAGIYAQDTLPNFSVVNKGNGRIVISWSNPYKDTIRQLSIQRSFDSLKTFKSILTLPDPTVVQNGYVDGQAPAPAMFYRLYILLDNGRYLFSKSKRPTIEAGGNQLNVPVYNNNAKTTDLTTEQIKMLENDPRKILYIKVKETFLGQMPESNLTKFRDSIRIFTKDTLLLIPPDTLLIRPFVPVSVFKPSRFVFTDKDGNIKISLPDAGSNTYSLKFFEDNGSQLFEIKHIKDPVISLDKVNFNHSGWFRFELYDDGKLKESSKFFVPKDF